MGEPQIDYPSPDSAPVQPETSMSWSQPAENMSVRDGISPGRLEWIAIILFIVSFFVMLTGYSLFIQDEGIGLAVVAISTATAVMLLLSVVFSVFGMTSLSKITVGIGIAGLMILVVSIGAKLMQTISEYHDRWFL